MAKSKLQNIKAVKEMIAGEHRSQTKTIVGFSDAVFQGQKQKNRDDGEIWEEKDSTGKTICWWEMKDGYKTRYNVHPDYAHSMQKMRDWLRSFPNCPKETCTCTAPKPIDKKFRKLTGMCEDCTISHETSLKIQGKFNQYAMDKLKANADAFLQDADKEVEVLKSAMRNLNFVDESGIETWTADNIEYYIDQIDSQYAAYKAGLSEKLGVSETSPDAPGLIPPTNDTIPN